MNALDLNHIMIKEIITVTFALFAVIDILGSIPILISVKNKIGAISPMRATLVSGFLIFSFFIVGELFLSILGLDIASFAMAGSIVMFVLAMEMVLGVEFFKADDNAKASMIVPIAFPLIAGTGTLTTVMSMKSLYHPYNIVIGVLLNLIFIFAILRSINFIEKLLGSGGILVIRKFFGVILLAIAVKMFRNSLVMSPLLPKISFIEANVKALLA
jgi:multiple antibiotic resistance protein